METEKSSINIASMKRIMLKLSGEILVGNQEYGLDPQKLMDIAEDIANVPGIGKLTSDLVYNSFH